MEEDRKTLGERRAESQQRAYELGLRYGYIDARAGRPGLRSASSQMGLSGREAELYDQGWHESYDAYMRALNEPGHHLSVPGQHPLERASATSTGRTRVAHNTGVAVLQVEVMLDGGTVSLWLPADVVRVTR